VGLPHLLPPRPGSPSCLSPIYDSSIFYTARPREVLLKQPEPHQRVSHPVPIARTIRAGHVNIIIAAMKIEISRQWRQNYAPPRLLEEGQAAQNRTCLT
jgi:hypothetical protein